MLHLAGVNVALIMLLFRLIMPLAQPVEQAYTEDVDITPWRFAKPVGFAVATIIAAMYIGLWSRFGLTPPGARVAVDYPVFIRLRRCRHRS